MVLVGTVTYRLVRLRPGLYEVFRLLDDARIGTFHMGPPMAFHAAPADVEILRDVARTALLQARTSWVRLDTRELEPR